MPTSTSYLSGNRGRLRIGRNARRVENLHGWNGKLLVAESATKRAQHVTVTGRLPSARHEGDHELLSQHMVAPSPPPSAVLPHASAFHHLRFAYFGKRVAHDKKLPRNHILGHYQAPAPALANCNNLHGT